MLVSKVAKLQREKSSEVLPAGCAGHFTKRRSKPVSAMTRPDNSMNNLWTHFAAGFRHKVSVIAARIRELQRMNPAHSATRSRVEICSQEGWGKAVEWQTYRHMKTNFLLWQSEETEPTGLKRVQHQTCYAWQQTHNVSLEGVDVSWNWQMDKTPAEANSPCVTLQTRVFPGHVATMLRFETTPQGISIIHILCPAPW